MLRPIKGCPRGLIYCGILCTMFIVHMVPAMAVGNAVLSSQSRPASRSTYQSHVTGIVADDAGKPVAGAEVLAHGWFRIHSRSTTDANGSFCLTLDVPTLSAVQVLARTDDGQRHAFFQYPYELTQTSTPTRLVLRPARTLAVRVVDADGKPVKDAQVEALELRPLGQARTDVSGWARLLVSADAPVRTIWSAKAGAGMDFLQSASDRSTHAPTTLPAEVKLVLRGARQVHVKALDSAGKPIEGAAMSPWTIHKTGNEQMLNLSGSEMATEVSGPDGVAAFDWMPSDMSMNTSIQLQDRGWSLTGPVSVPTAGNRVDLAATLLRSTRISGRVVGADGKPAANVLLAIQGEGRTQGYQQKVRTGPDGSFRADVYPDQMYIVGVFEPNLAARSIAGFIVRENQPRNDLVLSLAKGTKVHGQVTAGPGDRPIPDAKVGLIEQGPQLPRELAGDFYKCPTIYRTAVTDAQGRFEFLVGPGKHDLLDLTCTTIRQLKIADEEELTANVAMENDPSPRTVAGTVVDGQTPPQPVVGAVVQGCSTRLPDPTPPKAISDGQGRFRLELPRDRMVLWAQSKDGKQAGAVQIAENATAATIPLAPAAGASGVLVDAAGKPLAKEHLVCGIEVPALGTTATFTSHLLTDQDGRFTMQGLVPETVCRVVWRSSLDPDRDVKVVEFGVDDAGPIDLGKKSVDGPPPTKAPTSNSTKGGA